MPERSLVIDDEATNNADWRRTFQFEDAENGDLIDLSDSYIEVEIKDIEGCKRIEASTANGKLNILALGTFEVVVLASEMKALQPGSYALGGLFRRDDETVSLFTGSMTIIDGVAEI